MNHKKIELNSSINKDLELILVQIAKWHNFAPKLWNPDYRASTEAIEKTVQRIKNTKSEDLFLTIVEDEQSQMQGFIWAYKQENSQDSVMILSLYITEDFRGKGLAKHLKILLEEWCRNEGIKTIQTTTHYKNHNMIALNQKLGYIPGMVNMTKTL
ncbi:GNAT family N-acetyltransferase [Alkaliphilus peptidifermentans]|uniref:Protein N-acetyltransferase, RimJ/RimL family n=1 Tax=Alkaliphilus peptidifermentans DSM 18978 TaxID=1120976 RepID=A0A1G5GV53_9FIRM|nr:GNAT family N-acetyltransferase [Alkaliphilus peptidifermentans]SCY55247.1 Protein N-acetyltransferase, RimJ/RimL family [Alkaliphilus peptidifermentans DSM 18978]